MDRSRRQRHQSEDKQSTSLLIQQLAEQRQRRLDAAACRPHSASAHAAALELPASDSQQSDGSAQQTLSAAAAAANQAGSSKQGRSRLVRQDLAASATQQQGNEDVDDLAGMLKVFDLSSSSQSSGSSKASTGLQPTPSTAGATAGSSRSNAVTVHGSKREQFQDPSVASSGVASSGASEGNDRQAAAAAGLSDSAAEDASDVDQGSSADATDEIDDASSGNNSSSSEDDDEQLAAVLHSRRPLPAAVQPAAAGRAVQRPQAAAASPDDGGGSEDDAQASISRLAAAHDHSGREEAEGAAQQQSSAAAAAASAGALVLEGGFCLDSKVACKLYPHQVQGVKWLWGLHRMRKGGILADDMGLGKTMQCSGFLAGALQRSRHGNAFGTTSSSSSASSSGAVRAMIVAPKTLLSHWEKELRVCGMGPRSHCFHGSSEGERAAALRAVTGRGGVLLTTYGMVLHNAAQLRAGLGAAARDVDEHEDEEDPFCLQPPEGRRILWDYIILDEGHKVKNARTQLAQRLRELRAVCRVIISGTPVQNNLAELHALLDFAVPGLLGGPREFKAAFEKPIAAGQDRSAGLRVRELGAAKAAELRRIVGPFLLRREKREVFGSGGAGGGGASSSSSAGSSTAGGGSGAVVAAAAASDDGGGAATAGAAAAAAVGGSAVPAMMGAKHDLVVWLRLQPLQRHIYEAFLQSDAVKAALNSSKSPLAALTVLKKVCDHPALLSERATKLVLTASTRGQQGNSKHSFKSSKGTNQRRSSMDGFIVDDDDDDGGCDSGGDSGSGDDVGSESDGSCGSGCISKAVQGRAAVAASLVNAGFSDEFLSWAAAEGLQDRLLDGIRTKGPEASCKALFVADLLRGLVAGGHRTLVFSQSRVMLDILQAAVVARGWSFCRIDGSMSSTDARQAEVERFQAAGSRIPVFLLTTQVGGLGLTLTAANRVVIVDPSWNPATDNQSVDRAYRIGQTRDVVVYRLVTCGTVEEKIYRKQVFKGGLSRAGMEEGVQLRYFTHQELHELFKWDPAALAVSETQQLLTQQHKRSADLASIAAHMSWLEAHALCAGTSEHGCCSAATTLKASTCSWTLNT
ncbi:P-loop containing nucleoside triphosphate hydrolase protein [Scenedesmus sp. NREL 46B-D3]|nr:P-loop containing nucleoside triphosphate hydrolase protein [Scenedesmus sp. NREL 46B-D3]